MLMSKSRVLMFGWEYAPQITGGLGVACQQISLALAELDVEVAFVLPVIKKDLGPSSHIQFYDCQRWFTEVSTRQKVEVFQRIKTYPVSAFLFPYDNPVEYQRRLTEYYENINTVTHSESHFGLSGEYGQDLLSEVYRYAAMAPEFAAKIPHDVIHAHDWMSILAGISAKSVSGKPLIYHVHSIEYDRTGSRHQSPIFEIEKQGLEAADRIVAVSQYTKSLIEAIYQIPASKIDVVYNAVSKQPPLKTKPLTVSTENMLGMGSKMVLFLGRLTFQKGPDYFLKAAKKILDMGHDILFVFAGQGDMSKYLIEETARLRIGKNVHFAGFLSPAEVEALYQLSDLYVMPSVSEPFGLTTLEALNQEVPVVISNQSGVSEVIKGALKVDFWDVDDMVNKILSVLKSPALQRTLVAQGRHDLTKLQWQVSAEKLKTCYQQLNAHIQLTQED